MSDFKSYKGLLQSGENSPAWLLKPKGQAWLRCVGEAKDVTIERLKAAVKLRFASMAPTDGLAALGDERVLERGPSDTNATFAARLRDAWNIWRFGGTATGVLRALRDAGYGTAIIGIAKNRACSLDADGKLVTTTLPAGSWACDATSPSFWSKFVVFLPSNPWGENPADDDKRVELLRRLIRRWKSAHSICSDIAVLNAGLMWDWPLKVEVDGALVDRTWDSQVLAGFTWAGHEVLHYTP